MRSSRLIAIIVGACAVLAIPSANASTVEHTYTDRYQIDNFVGVSCPKAEDWVEVTGTVLVRNRVQTDAQGGRHQTPYAESIAASGVGLITGEQYQLTGGITNAENVTSGGAYAFTGIVHEQLVGHSLGPVVSTESALLHVTASPDRVVHVSIDQIGWNICQ
jgi:hypothetical protein